MLVIGFGVVIMVVGGYFAYFDFLLPIQWRRNNQLQLSRIHETKPSSASLFRHFIEDVEAETGWKVFITSGLRSSEEQAALKRLNAKNASAERSKHVLGLAIDLNLVQRQWFGYQRLTKVCNRGRWKVSGVLRIADRHGLKWGGDFSSYYDPVHFEITK